MTSHNEGQIWTYIEGYLNQKHQSYQACKLTTSKYQEINTEGNTVESYFLEQLDFLHVNLLTTQTLT